MRYVIVGNSAAGNAAAGAIRARDPAGQVTIVSEESHPAYYRPLMPFFIDGRVGFRSLFQDEAAAIRDADVRLGARVEEIDPDKKVALLRGGERLAYDRLLIATGASALSPSIPGLVEWAGSYSFRSMADVQAIKDAADKGTRAVVIGGGRVGTKAAMALRRKGLEVTVVEQGDRVVPFQFDHVAAEIVGRALEAWGIRVLLMHTVSRVERRNGVLSCELAPGGISLEADLIVTAVGIRPNVGLALGAAATVRNGVAVDRNLRTSLPDVYAAGDVAETTDIITGENIVPASWTSAVEMGRIAGHCMTGGESEYCGTLAVLNSFVLAGVPTVSVGLIQPSDEASYEVLTQRRGDSYRKLVLKDGRLVGALMVGDIEGAGLYTALIKREAPIVSSMLDSLMARRPSYATFLERAMLEPASAQRSMAQIQ
ncbi:MAG: NAD(P)/FAD-dependent oxidoreductase [Desulfomonile tiedjei]|nr:NAD(P)/FAD-dependent oxidoreductase [Desulfomonile tiedjei]